MTVTDERAAGRYSGERPGVRGSVQVDASPISPRNLDAFCTNVLPH